MKKIYELSEWKRKIILWVVIGIFTATLGWFWAKGAVQSIGGLHMPTIPKEITNTVLKGNYAGEQ